MQHAVAVRADRAQFLDWADFALLTDVRELPKVVHLDVRGAQFSVCRLEAEAADGALEAVMSDASIPSRATTIVCGQCDSPSFSLGIALNALA